MTDPAKRLTNQEALKHTERVTRGEVQIQPKGAFELAWDWVKGLVMPRAVSPLEQLLSPEGAAAEEGAFRVIREKVAKDYFADTGDYDAYRRIRQMDYDELKAFLESQ